MKKARKKKKNQTLSVIFQTLVAAQHSITVQLRNETLIQGVIHFVDEDLNMMMTIAKVTSPTGSEEQMSNVYINGRTIRYVELPEEMDISNTLERYREMQQAIRNQYKKIK